MKGFKVDNITNKQSGFIYNITNQQEASTINPNDEYYTPIYAIEPLLKYIKEGSVVWCPFDTEESNYVKYLNSKGHKATGTHISQGKDFFTTEPPIGTEYIISNPPYSLKAEVFKRLFDLNIPFAMLVGVVGLFESKRRFTMFKDNQFEVMYFNKRISYFKSYSDQKPSLNPPFSSAYICSKLLPKQIVFELINKEVLTLF
jgi:hypothetical protein